MKKIFTALILIISTSMGAQLPSYDFNTGDVDITIEAYPELVEPISIFMKEAYKYKVDLSPMTNIKGVYLADMSVMATTYGEPLGATRKDKDGRYLVFINERILFKGTKRMILYHELMHVLTFDSIIHCKGKRCPELSKEGSEIDSDEVLRRWKYHTKKLFKYIRKIQKNGTPNQDEETERDYLKPKADPKEVEIRTYNSENTLLCTF